MPRSDTDPREDIRSSVDWRGWIALAWVVWFGLLYGKMVVEQRGGKLRSALSRVAARPPDTSRQR